MLPDVAPEKMTARTLGVQPNTNSDQSDRPTASDYQALEIRDIQEAQRGSIANTVMGISLADHARRIMIRGDFLARQREVADWEGRVRTYLVATDLSDAATYALEWTIGTALRDGDTLLAVFAIDEEAGTGTTNESGKGKEAARPLSAEGRAQERLDAVEKISQTCIESLGKTKLQVRVEIEVFHCKNAKHVITQAVCISIGDVVPLATGTLAKLSPR